MKETNTRIAIVGMACRFPGGADSLDAYWHILKNGKDVVTEIPADRWGTDFYQHPDRKQPGKSYTFAAGVLTQIDQFDAGFFGISPREAEQMDPQQRLLLELAWEALENGGQVPSKLAGSNCAVYIGIASNDYSQRRMDDMASIDPYSMTGNTASIASNRISYVFDLKGPSVSVDTACSSSLVALHQACQSILSGDATCAITGGINMLLHPLGFVGFSKASMLSPTGRCRAFSAHGDGYVRAEGSAMLFLKPLAQAQADGDPIHAVIVASGINSDGHTHGITVPSSEQQGNLLRKVYAQSAIDFNDINYMEAHGTGTAVGDPLETRALGEVIGQARRPDNPLLIGSAKTNVGHLETASGMAGLLKAVLSLKHRHIPPSLHIQELNPHIDFATHNLQVVTQLTPMPDDGSTLRIGVNSFGFGGTNAHVLIESHLDLPTSIQTTASSNTLPPFYLSAATPAALQAQARQYAQWLPQQVGRYSDIAWMLCSRRQALPHGLFIHDVEAVATIAEKLGQYAQTEEIPSGMTQGQLLSSPSQPVLIFSGNGSQWQGMGRNLYQQSPLFQQAINEVATLLQQYSDYPLLTHFTGETLPDDLNLTEVAQPVLFAYQVGIVRLLNSQGIQPAAVTGHSVGEVAAAWAAGILSLAQAVRVIHERSHAQGKTHKSGRMAVAALSSEAAYALLAELGLSDRIEVAGINSPDAVTLAGDPAGLETFGQILAGNGIFFRLLDLEYAFHSHHMEAIKTGLLMTLQGLSPANQPTGIRFYSTVSGHYTETPQLDASYWWNNIRQPVQFDGAMQQLIADGFNVFIEVGPHPVLRSYISECLQAASIKGRILTTARRKDETLTQVHQAAFSAYLSGCPLNMSHFFPQGGRCIDLPSYPWQRERYWHPVTQEAYNLINRHREHPLLGYRLKDTEAGWENQLDAAILPYLADHVVDGAVIVPAAAYVEMALAASAQWYGNNSTHTLENLEIRAPIMLDGEHTKVVRFNLSPVDGSFTVNSRERLSDSPWTLNVSGRLTGASFKKIPAPLPLTKLQHTAAYTLSAEEHYHLTEQVGLTYKVAFQSVTQIWVNTLSALASLQVPQPVQVTFAQHFLHPVLLDAGFQVLVDIFRDELQSGKKAALIPIQISKLVLYQRGADACPAYVQVSIRKQSPRSVTADFLLLDSVGNILAELENCRFRGIQFGRSRHTEPTTYAFTPYLLPRITDTSGLSAIHMDALLAETAKYLHTHETELQRERHFQQILPLFEVMAGSFAWQTLTTFAPSNQTIQITELLASQGIDPAYQPLLEHLLAMLAEDGLASQQTDGSWRCHAENRLPSPEDIWLAILGDAPAYLPELVRLGRCGSHLSAVLRGEIPAKALLDPAKSSITEHWRDSAPSYRPLNMAIRHLLQQMLAQWPSNQRLRILEIGSPDASLTRLLLTELPTMQCDYVFAAFDSEQAECINSELGDYAFLSSTILPLDLGGNAYQHLKQQPFDLVLAAHTLHRLHDLPEALLRLRSLLKPAGWLLGLETQADRFAILTSGLQTDWWLPVESNTPDHISAVPCLFPPRHWQTLLTDAGFQNSTLWFEPDAITQAGAYLLLATAPKLTDSPQTTTIIQPVQTAGTCLILADNDGYSAAVATALSAQLAETGHTVICTDELALPSLPEHTRLAHVIQLLGLSPDAADNCPVMELQERRCIRTVELVQKLDAMPAEVKPRLWLITAGAMPFAANNTDLVLSNPAQAPLWGLGRVLMNEHPDLAPVLIDLQARLEPDTAARLLWKELQNPDGEDEILLGEQVRYGLRMQQQPITSGQQVSVQPDVCLDFSTPGLLKNLYWRALPERILQADEIEIRPLATGLNFRDVMYAMGLLSDEAVESGFAGASLGMELAGQVIRVGSAVQDFTVDDDVIGFAPACFSSSVITRTTAVAHKPQAWTYEEAATIPTTFFTVYYALHHLAHLEEGDRVLIHGASGGVGLAAIQFARYRGAEIFATAGTDEKREFVKLMGADHVLDSRSLKFADDILSLTHGEGVDIVLNSISGEAINRNLAILKPFGRFLELGKRDFYENTKIGLRPFRNNISYFGIDADQLLIERPALAKRLFAEMMALFREGVLRPLPYRAFPANRVVEAFRYMQQSRQIGKVIVSFANGYPAPSMSSTSHKPLQLSPQGTYLVTGGLSGFGLATARWLAEQGANSLLLLNRRGASTTEARQAIQQLRAQGVSVFAPNCDVTDKAALQAVLQQAQQTLPPLRGIIHAAMVLDDGIVRNLDAERFRKVLAPKMLGAWNLHQLTQNLPLDFFVLYSSATTYLGNPGQANYVAANLFLESLAQHRRTLGLPATFAAWGAIADAGYLARNDDVKEALQSRLGGSALESRRALALLGKLIQGQQTGMAVIDFDWHIIQRVMPAARSPKYQEQQRQATQHDHGDQQQDIHSLIVGMSEAEVRALIANGLVDEIGKILRLPAEKLQTNKSIFDLGMDSLMGMELVLAIEEKFGIRLPVMALTEGANIDKIAEKITSQLLTTPETGKTASPDTSFKESIAEAAAKHGETLSESELAQLSENLANNG